jgi:CheY-like chemotaxis protein
MVRRSYILIIEDDEGMREAVGDYLRLSHDDVRTVADGAEALALLQTGDPPACVISDVCVPGVLGTTVVDYMRATPRLRDVRVAFMTGSPELAPDGYRVFVKPLHLRELQAFVDA